MQEHHLLKEQEEKATTASESKGENSTLQQSKESAEIAANQDKQAEYEIKTKIRKQGYQSLEDGLKDIEAKKKEAETVLDNVRQIEKAATAIKEEAEINKQKALNALVIVKTREETVKLRLERAVTLEQSFKSKDAQYTILKQELQELIDYHKQNIAPCSKALRAVSKSIYSWIDLLNSTKYDFSVLYNYLGKVMMIIDRYVERMPNSIVNDILPKDEDSEQNKD